MRRTCSALIVIALALLSIGIVMLASASSVRGQAAFGDPAYFFKRQIVWLVVALAGGGAAVRFDYHSWKRLAPWLVALSLLLLVAVLIPGVGSEINGSQRWLRMGPLGIQPSELAKFTVVVGLAGWMAKTGRQVQSLWEGFLLPLAGLGLACGLIFLEPDFGTTLLAGSVGMAIMFAGGTRPGYLVIAAALGGAVITLAIMQDHERMGRVLAFLFPEKHPEEAYHLNQSKIAFVNGGAFGVGLGKSMQKQFYLPEAHTDFILAIVGEELGLVATAAVMLLFLGLLVCGLMISLRAPDPFGELLSFGLTMLLALQAAINIGVVTGCLPTKGIALPFISYGGSSLATSAVCLGVLINVGLHGGAGGGDKHTRLIRDRGHSF